MDSSPVDAAGDTKPPTIDSSSPEGGLRFCVVHAPSASSPSKFCDDFDDDSRTELKTINHWDVQTVLNGTPHLDSQLFFSPPAAFSVATAAIVDGESAHVHLRTTSKGNPTGHITFSFALRLATNVITKGAVAIATLDISQTHFFTLFLRDRDVGAPTATLEEVNGAVTTRHVLSKLPVMNAWARVAIDIDVAGSKATVQFGSDKVLDGAAIGAGGATMDPTIRLGGVYIIGPADPFEASFDDVLLEHD